MASMTGQQIYENFANAPGTGGLESARDDLKKIREEYLHLADEITRAAGALEEHWQGDAAGAAQRGAAPLVLVHAQASAEMTKADSLLDNQISEFHATKNVVKPVPPVPATPATFSEIGWAAQTNYLLSTQFANDAAQHNVAAMDKWTATSGDNGSRMPPSYGKIDPGAFSVAQSTDTGGPGAVTGFTGGPSGRKPRAGNGYPEPGSSGPRPSGPTTPPPGGPAAPSTVDPGVEVPAAKGPDDGTSAAGYTPPQLPGQGTEFPNRPVTPPPATPIGGGNPPWVTPGPGTGGYQPPGRGNFGPGLPPGAPGGRPGTPGGVSGRAPEAGGRPGSGPGSGAVGPRGGAQPGIRGAAGTAGKGGPGGMAPGAAGQRGKGGEDDEHQRKYVLDDDSHFLPSEKGEKIVDPTTGMSPTPPVIGK